MPSLPRSLWRPDLLLVLCLLGFAAGKRLVLLPVWTQLDLDVYRTGAANLAAGKALYEVVPGQYPFRYTPFAAILMVSAIAVPHETLRYWTHLMDDAARTGDTIGSVNQSAPAVLARLMHDRYPPTALVALVSVCAIAFVVDHPALRTISSIITRRSRPHKVGMTNLRSREPTSAQAASFTGR